MLVPAAHAAVGHPKADATGPAAITDLRAEAIGGEKVKLSWTAPEGDPAWYQVKRSAARIVERVEGWPDRTPPLPVNRRGRASHDFSSAWWPWRARRGRPTSCPIRATGSGPSAC